MSTRLCAALVIGLSLTGSASVWAQNPPAPAAAPAYQTVNIRLNGEAVPFTGQGAVQKGGAILVPLRGIFERLGADVKFDAATGSITAVKLDKTITLRVGDSTGFINGVPRALPAPATVINSAVMVPLRFITDSFGGQIEWDAQNLVANIVTEAVTAAKLPSPPADDSTVYGNLTGVYPEINAVTVRVVTSDNLRVQYTKEVQVQIRQIGTPKTQAGLNDLRIGDQMQIRRDKAGFAVVLQVLRDLRRGTIKEKTKLPNGNTTILFTNGSSVEFGAKAPVMLGGSIGSLDDVKVNEALVVRINLDTGIGISGAAVTASDPNPLPPDPNTLVEDTPPPIPADPNKPETKPEDPPPPAAAVKPEVKELTHDGAGKILKAGDMVSVTIMGTPGAKAAVTVAGLVNAREVELAEKADAPGTYTGTITIPVGITLKDAAVTATLTAGEVVTPVAQAADKLTIDSEGPEVMGTGPDDNATLTDTKPRIFGAYSDLGSKADQASLKILINGKDVTDKADITPAFFSYKPEEELPAGKVVVTIVVKDTLGNEARREWAFTVAPPEKPVRGLSVSPKDRALRSDEQVTVRLEGMAGGSATFKLGPLTEIPMREDPTGIYIGTYTVKKGDVLSKAPVAVSFLTRTGERLNLTAPETVTFAAGPPTPPIIDYPAETQRVRGGFVALSGRSTSDVKIKVVIRYTGKNLLKKTVNGDLTTVEVETDDKGNWKTNPIILDNPANLQDLTYIAEVIAVREGGELSAPSTVRFKK